MKVAGRMKKVIDALMAAALLLLMSYGLIGEKVHELLGIGMFLLSGIHHILNRHWYKSLGKGSYSAARLLSVAVDMLLIVVMIALPVSGIMMAKHTFLFLDFHLGKSAARTVHMLGSYWGYVLLSFHLGLHWNVMVGAVKKAVHSVDISAGKVWALRILASAAAGYGICAFFRRGIGQYMFLINRFAFFDYEEPLFRFYLDYLAVMALFVYAGHYTLKLCRFKKK